MEPKTIEQLHQEIKNKTINLEQYYQDLYVELNLQQARTNGFVTITKEKAFEDLKKCDGSTILNGIPAIFKDNFNTAGIKTTASSAMLENYVPIYDATVVKKLYEAGVVLIGKSSLDELAMGGTNKTALTGPVHNPWDLKRISGGSSGGSAALVASGIAPFALGSDTGDSIRKPAGFCGVVGFKPTWGRISRYGVIPYASSLDTVGAFTRNVRDMAIVTEIMAGRDDLDMTSSHLPVPNYVENLNSDLTGKKIAIIKQIDDELVDPIIIDNLNAMVELAKSKGAIVELVEMNQQLLDALVPTYKIIANSEATSNHSCLDGIKYGLQKPGASVDEIMIQSRTAGFGAPIRQRFILGNLALATENQDKMFRQAQRVRRLIVNEVQNVLKEYDVIMTPNSGTIAPLIDEATDSRTSTDYQVVENHLLLGNFAGTPSITIPSGFDGHMPIGINIMGRLFEEQTVLDVAYALESGMNYKDQYKREDK